ncbi:MAG TPA: hypothetical protein VGS22_22895 [Thermoanaerobaculia bacterium]|jgi:hypothetical protein|nr:hypothetical protein [Thermoanaerobaculia bacterium]
MKLNKQLWQVVATLIGLLATAASANAGNKVVEPGQEFSGKSYNVLAGEWTNWLVTEPIATNPAFDPDGRFCGLNQHGKVWFLASTFDGVANRRCEVPAGKAIFLSLGGVFVSFAPEFPAADDPCSQLATDAEKVRCDVNNDVPAAPTTSLEAALDGEPIGDLFAFRAMSPPGGYTLRIPDPSFLTDLGLPAGDRSPAVADGYFLFLKPLERGRHTLTFRMTRPDQTVTGVNYTLIVRGGDHN